VPAALDIDDREMIREMGQIPTDLENPFESDTTLY